MRSFFNSLFIWPFFDREEENKIACEERVGARVKASTQGPTRFSRAVVFVFPTIGSVEQAN